MTVLGWGEEMSVPKVTPRPPEIAPSRQATPVMALSLFVSWVDSLTLALTNRETSEHGNHGMAAISFKSNNNPRQFDSLLMMI